MTKTWLNYPGNDIDKYDLRIYTDGGYRRSSGLSALAFILDNGQQVITGKRAFTGKTNQQMELGALFEALKYSQRYHKDKVLIITDSKYVMNIFVEGWIYGWLKRDWKRSDGSPVKNAALIKAIYEEIIKFDWVDFKWVKGHANTVGNVRVDHLVNQAMDDFK